MKCGSCKGDHATVAEVRACYGHASMARPAATEAQVKYIQDLLRQLEREPLTFHEVANLSRSAASDEITALLAEVAARPKPTKPTTASASASASFRTIVAGYYAVPSLTGNNDLDFFRVDVPEEGRWAGYRFVKRIIGGRSGAFHIAKATQVKALEAIAAEPEKAALRFGQELGRCYRCGRTLTDETSRALGIGPDCRSRH